MSIYVSELSATITIKIFSDLCSSRRRLSSRTSAPARDIVMDVGVARPQRMGGAAMTSRPCAREPGSRAPPRLSSLRQTRILRRRSQMAAKGAQSILCLRRPPRSRVALARHGRAARELMLLRWTSCGGYERLPPVFRARARRFKVAAAAPRCQPRAPAHAPHGLACRERAATEAAAGELRREAMRQCRCISLDSGVWRWPHGPPLPPSKRAGPARMCHCHSPFLFFLLN
jgi:hypothetical protein